MRSTSTKRRFFFTLSLSKILIFFVWALFLGTVFYLKVGTIQDISCKNDDHDCSEPVHAELAKLTNHFLFSPDIEKTVEKIKKFEPNTKDIVIRKKFPHMLSVEIYKEQPELIVNCHNDQMSFSNTGSKLSNSLSTEDQHIPQIAASDEFCKNIQDKKTLDPKIVKEMTPFIKTFQGFSLDNVVIWESETTLTVHTAQEQTIIFSTDRLSYQLELFQIMMKEPNLPPWKSLDLRFNKAVLVPQSADN